MLVSHLTNSKKNLWKKIQEQFLPLEGVQNCLCSKHTRTVQLTSGATSSLTTFFSLFGGDKFKVVLAGVNQKGHRKYVTVTCAT